MDAVLQRAYKIVLSVCNALLLTDIYVHLKGPFYTKRTQSDAVRISYTLEQYHYTVDVCYLHGDRQHEATSNTLFVGLQHREAEGGN